MISTNMHTTNVPTTNSFPVDEGTSEVVVTSSNGIVDTVVHLLQNATFEVLLQVCDITVETASEAAVLFTLVSPLNFTDTPRRCIAGCVTGQ